MRPRRHANARTAGRRINVNTATEAELEALPGVGPVIARPDSPPYRSWAGALMVPGSPAAGDRRLSPDATIR